MSAGIDAARTLLSGATESLATMRSEVREFVGVLRTTTDPNVRYAQGVERLAAASLAGHETLDSLKGARAVLVRDPDAELGSIIKVEDAHAAVRELTSTVDGLRQVSPGTVSIHPFALRDAFDEAGGLLDGATRRLPPAEPTASNPAFAISFSNA